MKKEPYDVQRIREEIAVLKEDVENLRHLKEDEKYLILCRKMRSVTEYD